MNEGAICVLMVVVAAVLIGHCSQDRSSELHRELRELTSRLEQLRSGNRHKASEIQRLGSVAQLDTRIRAARARRDALESQRNEERERAELLESALTRPRQRVSAAKQASAVIANLKEVPAEIDYSFQTIRESLRALRGHRKRYIVAHLAGLRDQALLWQRTGRETMGQISRNETRVADAIEAYRDGIRQQLRAVSWVSSRDQEVFIERASERIASRQTVLDVELRPRIESARTEAWLR